MTRLLTLALQKTGLLTRPSSGGDFASGYYIIDSVVTDLRLVPAAVEGSDVVGDREAEVGNGDHDGDLVAGDEEAHQPRLEHVGREEGEKYDDEGEH